MTKYRYTIYCLLISLAVMFAMWLQSCRTTTTTTIEPLQREEIPPYLEQVMREYCDSCRVTERRNEEFEEVFTVRCKKKATKIRAFLIQN